MELKEIIERCQAKVGADPDGNPGPLTWTAIAKALGVDLSESKPKPPPVSTGERVDERSEAAIATLHRKVQPVARQFVKLAAETGITIKITSGTRTYAEQDALFRKGNVTKARGGYSNHNFGIAIDVTIFKDGKPVWESPQYKTLGKLGKSLGFTWGGDWTSFVDEPHYQLEPPWAVNMTEKAMLQELRHRHDLGMDVFE